MNVSNGLCGGSATAAVEEYHRRFPTCRIPDRKVFSKIFNTLRASGMLPSAHVSSERGRQLHIQSLVTAFGIKYTFTFLLKITDAITFQNIDLSF